MSIFKHELRRGTKSLLIWAASIGFMLVLCDAHMNPDMKGEVDSMGICSPPWGFHRRLCDGQDKFQGASWAFTP